MNYKKDNVMVDREHEYWCEAGKDDQDDEDSCTCGAVDEGGTE